MRTAPELLGQPTGLAGGPTVETSPADGDGGYPASPRGHTRSRHRQTLGRDRSPSMATEAGAGRPRSPRRTRRPWPLAAVMVGRSPASTDTQAARAEIGGSGAVAGRARRPRGRRAAVLRPAGPPRGRARRRLRPPPPASRTPARSVARTGTPRSSGPRASPPATRERLRRLASSFDDRTDIRSHAVPVGFPDCSAADPHHALHVLTCDRSRVKRQSTTVTAQPA